MFYETQGQHYAECDGGDKHFGLPDAITAPDHVWCHLGRPISSQGPVSAPDKAAADNAATNKAVANKAAADKAAADTAEQARQQQIR